MTLDQALQLLTEQTHLKRKPPDGEQNESDDGSAMGDEDTGGMTENLSTSAQSQTADWTEVTNEKSHSDAGSRNQQTNAQTSTYRLEVKFAAFVSTDVERVREAVISVTNKDDVASNSLGTKLWLNDTPTRIGSALANLGTILATLESPIIVILKGAQ